MLKPKSRLLERRVAYWTPEASLSSLLRQPNILLSIHALVWSRVFFYGALGEAKLLEILSDCHLRLRHFELVQYPEKHLVLISSKDCLSALTACGLFHSFSLRLRRRKPGSID